MRRPWAGTSALGAAFVDNLPKLEEPLVARKLVSIFVATKAQARGAEIGPLVATCN